MKKRALSGLLKLDGPLLSILSLLIAIVISGVIMAVCGYNPIEAFGAILAGSFGSQRAIVQTLTQATPLIFTGLAFAFAKKASLINLGAEGQLYMGALASAAVGMLDLGLPMALHLPLAGGVDGEEGPQAGRRWFVMGTAAQGGEPSRNAVSAGRRAQS